MCNSSARQVQVHIQSTVNLRRRPLRSSEPNWRQPTRNYYTQSRSSGRSRVRRPKNSQKTLLLGLLSPAPKPKPRLYEIERSRAVRRATPDTYPSNVYNCSPKLYGKDVDVNLAAVKKLSANPCRHLHQPPIHA